MAWSDTSSESTESLQEKTEYLRNVEEELARREQRLSELLHAKAELERELNAVSVRGAFLSGDVAKMRMIELRRKSLKVEMEKNHRLVAAAQDEIRSARDRKEAVKAEIAEICSGESESIETSDGNDS